MSGEIKVIVTKSLMKPRSSSLSWYLLQELVIQSVCAVELEDHMSGEGVFDAAHHIFCLGLRQLHWLRRLEERAKPLELWDGRQLFCQMIKNRDKVKQRPGEDETDILLITSSRASV